MKFLLRLTAWATATFVIAWAVAAPYQRALAGVAGVLAAPRGTTIEWVDLELFFPYDLGVYVAMCLASAWATWRARGRALALGLPLLVALELLALVLAMKAMIGASGATAAHAAEVQRLALGIIRVTGLIAAAAAWAYFLGREALGLLAPAPVPSPHSRSRRKP